jgi:hypothetical protein
MLRRLHISFGPPNSQQLFIIKGEHWMMDTNSVVFLATLRQLQGLCDLFSRHIRPGQLDLEISFSAANIESGLAILRSLHHIPPVQQVSFSTRKSRIEGLGRLNSNWQGLLRQHARELIHRPLSQSQFERLPNEIQLMILYHVVTTKLPIHYDRLGLGALHPRCPAPCNRYSRPPRFNSPGCCGKCRRYLSWKVCRCTSGSFFSSSCICPILDDGIFFVSKRIRAHALDIFFIDLMDFYSSDPTKKCYVICTIFLPRILGFGA